MIDDYSDTDTGGSGFTVSPAARQMVARFFQNRPAAPIRIFHNYSG
jgi:hypothetical protein